jgi:hypothetical protein
MPRRVLETRRFGRWARKAGLPERVLCKAVEEMSEGLIDADLGGGVVKKRVPVPGRGKRGGARTVVATNRLDRWVFLFGFEKNERADVTPDELEALKQLASDLLECPARELDARVRAGVLREICDDCETQGKEPDPGGGPRDRT